MTSSSLAFVSWRHSLWIVSLVAASVLLTLGFACALPIAAFATIAALTAGRREALAIMGAIWFANQAFGFAFLHYPADAVTLAWGGALGAIALLSCEVARSVLRRLKGVAGSGLAFLAAFVAYEGAIFLICLATGRGADDFTASIVSRIFVINACAFLALLAWSRLCATFGLDGRAQTALAARHV
jgi:hypothetical protein